MFQTDRTGHPHVPPLRTRWAARCSTRAAAGGGCTDTHWVARRRTWAGRLVRGPGSEQWPAGSSLPGGKERPHGAEARPPEVPR